MSLCCSARLAGAFAPVKDGFRTLQDIHMRPGEYIDVHAPLYMGHTVVNNVDTYCRFHRLITIGEGHFTYGHGHNHTGSDDSACIDARTRCGPNVPVGVPVDAREHQWSCPPVIPWMVFAAVFVYCVTV
jgi:hypothetical protein